MTSANSILAMGLVLLAMLWIWLLLMWGSQLFAASVWRRGEGRMRALALVVIALLFLALVRALGALGGLK